MFGLDGIGGEGAFGTVQLGYDRQLSSRFVLGAFLDYDFSASAPSFASAGDSSDIDLDHMWSVGARVGWLASPDTMVYASLPTRRANMTCTIFGVEDSMSRLERSAPASRRGLGDNWSLKGEYRFTQFDEENIFD